MASAPPCVVRLSRACRPSVLSAASCSVDFASIKVYQAMGVKTQAEHFRRHRLTLRRSRGLTMGALFWHLNDVWQAPSWSSIDYLGNWKMLHYFAVRFFAPLLVSAYVDGDRLLVYAIDDLYAGEPYNLRLDVRLYHYGSFVPRLSLTHVFPMSSLVQVVSAKNLSELLSSASCSRNNSFLTFRLSNDSDGETLSSNFLLLQVPRLATEIPSAALKISNVSALHSEDESLRGSNVHEIELKTDAVALFVWLSAGRVRGRFSDNGFIMVDKTTSLTFTSDLPLDVAQLRLNISVTCLNCLRHAGYSPMADIKTQ
ncbi:beta-mannosidase [Ixodes scapularis]